MTDRRRIKTKTPGVYYRERPDGTRQYVIWFEGTDGRAHFQNVPGGEREAKQARARVVDRIAHGHKVAPSRKLFADFAKEWLEEQTKLRDSTLSAYRLQIDKHLIPRLGQKTKLSEVDVDRVAKLISSMQRDGKKAWTIRAALTPLSRIMATAVRRGMAPINPVTQLDKSERPKGDQATMNILDTDEIKLLLANTKHKALFATAIFTGLRISELLRLTWGDVDFAEGVIHVRQSKTKAGIREVILMPALQQILAAHSLENQGEYVFEAARGGSLRADVVRKDYLKPALKRAGITKHIRFHDLRHTFASILISEGYDRAFIAEQLGHANISTLDIYTHLFDKKKKREAARSKLEAAFGEVLS